MIPVNFEQSNVELIGGDPSVKNLPAYFEQNRGLWSCWQVSEEELALIKDTGKIWLLVASSMHPPVLLSVQGPFVEASENEWPEKLEEKCDAMCDEHSE